MTLTDLDLESAIADGQLIRGADHARIGPVCYELRMGQIYYDLSENDLRIDVGPAGIVLIKPGHRVVLITMEEVVVPHNMIARVVSKGSLFSVGLSPVCTYADPGFEGQLGIVTQNISNKYIQLPVGEPLAKVDFSFLTGAVRRPYIGQHGFQLQIWPIKHHLQKTYEQVKSDSRVESEKQEGYKLLPTATAAVLKRMERRQKTVDIAILVAVVINALILAVISTDLIDTTVGLVGNLLASAIVAAIVVLARRDGSK